MREENDLADGEVLAMWETGEPVHINEVTITQAPWMRQPPDTRTTSEETE